MFNDHIFVSIGGFVDQASCLDGSARLGPRSLLLWPEDLTPVQDPQHETAS